MNLILINDFCLTESVSCYSILQPTLVAENSNQSSKKIKQAKFISSLYHGFSFDNHINIFNQMYAVNMEIFGENNTIDTRKLNGSDEDFFDHIHQSPSGTSKLSKMIFDKIQHDVIFQD